MSTPPAPASVVAGPAHTTGWALAAMWVAVAAWPWAMAATVYTAVLGDRAGPGAALLPLAVLGPFAWAMAVGIAETRKAHLQGLPKGAAVAAIAISAPVALAWTAGWLFVLVIGVAR